MKVTLQRVLNANVKVGKNNIGSISQGMLIFIGIASTDNKKTIELMGNKILNLRIFNDTQKKMNYSVLDIKGEILIVSQFTLAGKFLKGNRPSFVKAKSPEIAGEMISKIVQAFSKYVTVKTGSFGAMMDVGLINDGPATFVLTARNGELIDQAD